MSSYSFKQETSSCWQVLGFMQRALPFDRQHEGRRIAIEACFARFGRRPVDCREHQVRARIPCTVAMRHSSSALIRFTSGGLGVERSCLRRRGPDHIASIQSHTSVQERRTDWGLVRSPRTSASVRTSGRNGSRLCENVIVAYSERVTGSGVAR